MIETPHIKIFRDTASSDEGETFEFLRVEIDEGTIMHQYLSFEGVDSIFLLKYAIDKFITNDNLIDPMKKKDKKTSEEQPVPGYCTILEGYLNGWAPVSAFSPGVILKTSQEITDDLQDMVDIDTFTLASIMSQLGFRAHYAADGGPHGWMMLRAPGTVHIIRPATLTEDE